MKTQSMQHTLAEYTIRPKFTLGELKTILAHLPQTSTLWTRLNVLVAKTELEISLGLRSQGSQISVSKVRSQPLDFAELDSDIPASPPAANITLPLTLKGVSPEIQSSIFNLFTSDDLDYAPTALDSLLQINSYTRADLDLPDWERQRAIQSWWNNLANGTPEKLWEEVFRK